MFEMNNPAEIPKKYNASTIKNIDCGNITFDNAVTMDNPIKLNPSLVKNFLIL